MKNISVSKDNWKKLRELRDELDTSHFNNVITHLLSRDVRGSDINGDDESNDEMHTNYDIQCATCSECHYEFDFVVDQNEMFLCCPKCGKTKKIKIE